MACFVCVGKEAKSPIVSICTLFLFISGKYTCENSFGNFIIKSTSGFGRFQFSVENAYSVNTSTLYLTAIRTVFLTTDIPSLCPAIRGNPFFPAHLPLPSIIIAICEGIFSIISLDDSFCFVFLNGNHIDILCPPKGLNSEIQHADNAACTSMLVYEHIYLYITIQYFMRIIAS